MVTYFILLFQSASKESAIESGKLLLNLNNMNKTCLVCVVYFDPKCITFAWNKARMKRCCTGVEVAQSMQGYCVVTWVKVGGSCAVHDDDDDKSITTPATLLHTARPRP